MTNVIRLLSPIVAFGLWAAPALAADRLSDRDVKALVERIDGGRDTFEGALDNDLKRTVVRSPTGEVDVKRALDDFKEGVHRLEERLKPEYAGSNEAAALLRRATALDVFLRQQPAGLKGTSEWNRLATDLKALAAAYGTDFPLPENASVRRIGDHELASAAEQLAKAGEHLKKSLDADLKKDTSVTAQQRQAAVADAEQWSKDAKALRDRVKDGKPSSAEAERVVAGAAKVQSFVEGRTLPASSGVWSSSSPSRQMLTQAYGIGVK
jgi:hypothetical protein